MMRKLLLVVGMICIASSFVFGQEAAVPTTAITSEPITLNGIIIDNKSAGTKTPEELIDFIKTYTKQYALTPDCVASGYSIFANGNLRKFDKESSAKIEEFLKKEDSKLEVVAIAKMTTKEAEVSFEMDDRGLIVPGSTILKANCDAWSLVSIENQVDGQGGWHTFKNDNGSIYGDRIE